MPDRDLSDVDTRLTPEDVRIMLDDLLGLASMGESWMPTLIERIENEKKRWRDA